MLLCPNTDFTATPNTGAASDGLEPRRHTKASLCSGASNSFECGFQKKIYIYRYKYIPIYISTLPKSLDTPNELKVFSFILKPLTGSVTVLSVQLLTALDGMGGHLERDVLSSRLRYVHTEHQADPGVFPTHVCLALPQLNVGVSELQDAGAVDSVGRKEGGGAT